tara:strand:+ start:862 stop:1647 length:786 start_codon:yes stop_codon:yes gene_type:complete
MKTNQISVQLYSTRKFLPYDQVLNFFSESGIKNIELFDIDNIDENEMSNLLAKNNLSALSAHVSFSGIKNFNSLFKKLKTLGIRHAIVPAPDLPPGGIWEDNFNKDEKEWIKFGNELSSFVDIFEDNGFTLGYHNHSFEFSKLPSGKLPIEYMMEQNEKLKFEIDIGWTIAGKADPLDWITKYSDKIIACHLKDFFSKDKNLLVHSEQCSIGEGFIDWKNILSKISNETKCEVFAIEHDDPKDYKDYTLKSIDYLNSIDLE